MYSLTFARLTRRETVRTLGTLFDTVHCTVLSGVLSDLGRLTRREAVRTLGTLFITVHCTL